MSIRIDSDKKVYTQGNSGTVSVSQDNGNTSTIFALSQEREQEEREQRALPIDERKPKYTIEALTSDNVIKKFKTINNADVYTAMTECKNGKLVEHYYVLDTNNKFYEVDKNGNILKRDIKPSEVEKSVKEAKALQEAAKNTSESYENFKKEPVNYSGDVVYNKVYGATEDRYYTRINTSLHNLDKDSVVGFLADYYKESGYTDKSDDWGFLGRLDTEHDSGEIKMNNKKNVVESLLAKAKECGLDNDPDYKEIANIMYDYKEDQTFADRETFRGSSWKGSRWRNALIRTAVYGATAVLTVGCVLATIATGGLAALLWGAGAAAAAGSGAAMGITSPMHKETDSSILDKAMYRLHKKIMEKVGANA